VLDYILGRVFSHENTVKTMQQQPTNLNLYQSSYIGVFMGKHPTRLEFYKISVWIEQFFNPKT